MICTVIDDLNREWRDLVETGSYARHLQEWTTRWPVLDGYLDNLDSARDWPDGANAVFEALAEEYRQGSYPAGRTLLQCMLPMVLGAARFARSTPLYHDALAAGLAGLWTGISTCLEDPVGQAASTLFEALRGGARYGQALQIAGLTARAVAEKCYSSREFSEQLDQALVDGRDPALAHGTASAWADGCNCPDCRTAHDRRCGRTRREPGTKTHRAPLATKLWYAVRTAVAGLECDREVSVAPTALGDTHDGSGWVLGIGGEDVLGESGTVLRLIAWGLDTGIISSQEAQALACRYTTDEVLEYATLAADLGVAPHTLRKRVSRAIGRLRRAVMADDERYLAVWDQTYSALAADSPRTGSAQ